jgi:acetyl esterase/lipase
MSLGELGHGALDHHVKRFLDVVAAAGVGDVSRLTPAEMRQAFLDLALTVDVRNVPIGNIESSTLPGPHGRLPVRIYTPLVPAAEPLAGIVYFHGGGGVFCNLDTHDGFCRLLANSSGCRLVSVDYRLAPEHRFPAAVEDSYAATKWVVDHASQFNIDADRVGIAGDSAGGNMAAVVCQLAKQAGGPRLALQVLFCPITDMTQQTESRRTYAEGYFLDKDMLEWTFMHYCAASANFADHRLSPLLYEDPSKLPTAHIHTAEFDPLRDEGKAYADRLKQAGVKVCYICHPGMIHHFYGMGAVIPYARQAVKAAGAAIKTALA